MPLKTPSFWQSYGLLSQVLRPLGLLYLLGHKINQCFKTPYQSSIPVICVGGVVAGGSGKTPTVHALIKLIQINQLYQNPVILSRGYGGHMKGPTQVQSGYHDAGDVGDEALLHAQCATTIISTDRAAGVALAASMGADIVIMDDGFQNNSIRKDLSLLVIDAAQGIGNGYLLPAGPLREPLKDALERSDAVLMLNGDIEIDTDKPVLKASYLVSSSHDLKKIYYAFAGLGHPEKFKNTLLANGFSLSGFQSFADHHTYSDNDLSMLKKQAEDSTLITTEKDYARLSDEQRNGIEALHIELMFQSPETITYLIHDVKQR